MNGLLTKKKSDRLLACWTNLLFIFHLMLNLKYVSFFCFSLSLSNIVKKLSERIKTLILFLSFKLWQLTCGVCFETFPSDKLHAAACGHPFCDSCWEGLFYSLS